MSSFDSFYINGFNKSHAITTKKLTQSFEYYYIGDYIENINDGLVFFQETFYLNNKTYYVNLLISDNFYVDYNITEKVEDIDIKKNELNIIWNDIELKYICNKYFAVLNSEKNKDNLNEKNMSLNIIKSLINLEKLEDNKILGFFDFQNYENNLFIEVKQDGSNVIGIKNKNPLEKIENKLTEYSVNSVPNFLNFNEKNNELNYSKDFCLKKNEENNKKRINKFKDINNKFIKEINDYIINKYINNENYDFLSSSLLRETLSKELVRKIEFIKNIKINNITYNNYKDFLIINYPGNSDILKLNNKKEFLLNKIEYNINYNFNLFLNEKFSKNEQEYLLKSMIESTINSHIQIKILIDLLYNKMINNNITVQEKSPLSYLMEHFFNYKFKFDITKLENILNENNYIFSNNKELQKNIILKIKEKSESDHLFNKFYYNIYCNYEKSIIKKEVDKNLLLKKNKINKL